ncbi:26S proteasome regulatory subunit 8 [Blastocladiella emersonii ATCC 22665]|nr:26S proteasome regulatory subunit 8 [Blastocladiella emersonii ATCC 22665]
MSDNIPKKTTKVPQSGRTHAAQSAVGGIQLQPQAQGEPAHKQDWQETLDSAEDQERRDREQREPEVREHFQHEAEVVRQAEGIGESRGAAARVETTAQGLRVGNVQLRHASDPAVESSPTADPAKQPLSVVVIGTQDAGKSTATGHLVYKSGLLDAATLAAFEQAASAALHSTTASATPPTAPPHFQYAWLMDRVKAAREQGHPTDVHPDAAKFASQKYLVNVIDVPGHRDFVHNLITGASRADIAILFVSAVPAEFARGMGTAVTAPSSPAAAETSGDMDVDAPSADSDAAAARDPAYKVPFPTDDASDDQDPAATPAPSGAGGETIQHAMLAFTLGVKQLIVAVNKMDQVAWSADRFHAVCADTSAMLRRLGYNIKTVPFVPVSGATGDNLLAPSEHMPWFAGWRRESKAGDKSGTTLIQAIDAIDPPRRLADKPLRITVQDVYKVSSVGTMPVGRVEAGVLRVGMQVRFAPGGATGTVTSVETGGAASSSGAAAAAAALSSSSSSSSAAAPPTASASGASTPARLPHEAHPGDSVGFGVSNVSLRDVRRGCIASDATTSVDTQAFEAVAFTASLVVMVDHAVPSIAPGYTPIIDIHTAHVPVRITDLLAKVDRRNGQVIEEHPRSLKPGDAAVVRLVPSKPLCVEPFSECPPLGRFALRDHRHTIAVGVIKSVEKKMDDGRIVVFPRKQRGAGNTAPASPTTSAASPAASPTRA